MKTLSFYHTRGDKHTQAHVAQLQTELAAAREDLRQAYRRFDQVVDDDLIEACIYQMNAAMAQCNYLVRTIKQLTQGELPLPLSDAVAAMQLEEEATWT